MRRFLIPLALLFALAGCSATPPVEAGRECLTVPDSALASIAEGANENPIKPIAAAGVKSAERGDMTVIAMSFTDEREADTVLTGVWGLGGGVDSEPISGPWVAIDSFAQSWTVFPSSIEGEALSVTEDGAADAQACLASLSE